MATIISLEGVLRSRDPQFRSELDAVKACLALKAHFDGALLTPEEAAEALETIRYAIPPVERTFR